MTSTFVRVAPDFPVVKVSFTSQEWCGHVYHHLVPRGPKIESVAHSYFDGEADQRTELPLKPGGVFEDQLWITVRKLLGEAPPQGVVTVPFLPSLWSARGLHRPLAWVSARIEMPPGTSTVKTPAGVFTVRTATVRIEGGETLTFDIESTGARRIIRWKSSDGEVGELLASKRLPYWKLNSTGGEAELKGLGLLPVSR